MRVVIFVFSIIAIAFFSGCSAIEQASTDHKETLNPKKIHGIISNPNDTRKELINFATNLPIDDYYQALNLAKTNYSNSGYQQASQDAIVNYINEGVGLVNTYCSRWFNKLDDKSRILAYNDNNINVITQLTTALLGVGGASNKIVATYGAATTAYAGMSDNYNAAFLVAPTTSKVRKHIVSAMQSYADELKTKAPSMQFKEAYTSLEDYANLCTHAKAKEIIDQTLDLSTSEAKMDGKLTTRSINRSASAVTID